MLAWRLPRELSIVSPRSRCDSCEREIPWWANIPISAYSDSRDDASCAARRFRLHFLAEISLAVTALYLYLAFRCLTRSRASFYAPRMVVRDHRLRIGA